MDPIRQLFHNPPAVLADLARLSLWLIVMLLVFIPLERLAGLRPAKPFRAGFGTDLGYYFIGGILPKLLLVLPVAGIAWVMHFLVPDRIHIWVATLSFWPRLLAALVVGEFGFYWGHRWTHEIPLLWRFHAIHHSPEHLDWLVNTRAHPVDLVFTRICGFVPMYACGLVQPIAGQFDLVPLIVLAIGSSWGYFVHANIRWRFGWLEQMIATPGFHHWHHTNDHRRDRNYAAMLPWMDRIFGTYHMPAREFPTVYGIDAKLAPGLIGQLIEPMRPPRAATQGQEEGWALPKPAKGHKALGTR